MSLINEALKKAQRQRSDQPPGLSPGGRMESRSGQPMRTQSIVLIAAGAAVLVVFSVLITVYLVNKGPGTPVAAVTATTTSPKPSVTDSAPLTPVTVTVPPVAAVSIPAAVTEKPATASTAPAVEASPTVAALSPPSAAPIAPPPTSTAAAAPVVAATTPALVQIPPVTTAETPELKIQLFVDAIRVMGIRSSGGESKVLMNDRVYRVNDIVDRTLALKLVKVEPEVLTFTDKTGAVYTKSF